MLNEEQAKYWMEQAEAIAKQSQDPERKVGALLLFDVDGTGNCRVKGTGYNDFPAHLPPKRRIWNDKFLKNRRVIHAETAAIVSACVAQCNIMVITNRPCLDCAKLIVATGSLHQVVVPKMDIEQSSWADSMRHGDLLLRECGIEILEI